MRPLAIILLAAVGTAALPAPAPPPAMQEPDDALSGLDLKAERKALERLADALAKSGRTRAVAAVRDEFERFGAEQKDVEKLRERTNKALLKAKPARNAKAAEKQLEKDLDEVREVAAAIAARGAEAEPAQAEALYRAAIRLDSDCAAARQGLGHSQDDDGAWRSDRERALWKFRHGFADALVQARALDFPLEDLEVQDSLLTEVAQGEDVSALGFGPVRLEGGMARAGLARRFEKVLRGAAVANWLATGKLEPAVGAFTLVMQPAGDPWTRYVDGAVTHQWLGPQERDATLNATGSWQIPQRRKGDFLWWYAGNTKESLVETLFKVDRSLLGGKTTRDDWDKVWKLTSPDAPYWLTAGVMNLVGLSTMDSTWNNIPFEPGSPADGSAVDAQGVELESKRHLMLLPVARAWMADEAAAGRGMAIAEVLQTRPGDLTSRRLLQLTFMVEFLAARDGLDAVLERYRKAAGGKDLAGPTALQATFEPTLGQTPEEFGEEFVDWLLAGGEAPTVTGMLTADPGAKVDDGDLYGFQAAINEQRLAAGAPEVMLDPLLSAGCRDYAEALATGAEPETPGGKWASTHAVASADADRPEEQVLTWMATVHQRVPLLLPGCQAMGIGTSGDAVAVDMLSGSFMSGLWYAHWPPHESRELPSKHAASGPDSVPGQDNGALGYPVTLVLGAAHGEALVTMEMTGPDGPVDCWFTSPLAPLNPDHAPEGVYALIPKAPLTSGRQYDVTARWAGAELSWTFITD